MSICYLRFSAEMAGLLPLINAFLYLARMLKDSCYVKIDIYDYISGL